MPKHFDGHVSVCKVKEAYDEILQEHNFSFKMVSMDEVKKVVFTLNSKKSSTYSAMPASILKIYRGSLEIPDKNYQSFFKRIDFS